MPRRRLPWKLGIALTLLLCSPGRAHPPLDQEDYQNPRPNVVLVLSDDQGYGDFGFLGNPEIRTPNLDRMAESGTWMERFYVTPVCSSTRASLMTGRYNRRTGVLRNGAPMFASEHTMAERLGEMGYATGLFGKWHLGRHYPLRPMDQGFDEVLSFRGGVLREYEQQPVDVRYTNPMLEHNSTISRHEGFATDIFFDAAIDWMQQQARAKRPFFAYIAPAAPHGPYDDIPADTRSLYTKEQEERIGALNLDIYALVSKVDQNMGKLLAALEASQLLENTLVLYLSDNGPSHVNEQRYMAGIRGHKGDILEGGIKTPLLAHWPGVLKSRRIRAHMGSVVDLLPTILHICGERETDPSLDGRNLWKLWRDEEPKPVGRQLFVQISSKGNIKSNYALITQRYKLASPVGFHSVDQEKKLFLYDLQKDPMERKNLANKKRPLVRKLDDAFWQWQAALTASEKKDHFYRRVHHENGDKFKYTLPIPVPVPIDDPREQPVMLTRRYGPDSPAAEWLLQNHETGSFVLDLWFPPREAEAKIVLTFERLEIPHAKAPMNSFQIEQELQPGSSVIRFEGLELEAGIWRLKTRVLQGDQEVDRRHGVWKASVLSGG